MKNVILAISGGVDSMVLLDFFISRMGNKFNIIVAHFDHGIREDSEKDLALVRSIAEKHNLSFRYKKGCLGKNASEDQARDARYAFLRGLAEEYDAKIVTAHHKDDLVETVYINLQRGTGWRGLAVLDSEDVWRPFVGLTKQDILNYAKKNKIIWREDSTNLDDKYLRNRVRKEMLNLEEEKSEKIYELWQQQIKLKAEIESQDEILLKSAKAGALYSRYFFAQIEESEAIELLRYIVNKETDLVLTRPQLGRFWLNIKTLQANKKYNLAGNNVVEFTKTAFSFK